MKLITHTRCFCLSKDENDNTPIFTQEVYQVPITENLAPGRVIATVLANDADSGSNGEIAYYSSQQSLVEVNNMTGEVILIASPDFETLSVLSLEVCR